MNVYVLEDIISDLGDLEPFDFAEAIADEMTAFDEDMEEDEDPHSSYEEADIDSDSYPVLKRSRHEPLNDELMSETELEDELTRAGWPMFRNPEESKEPLAYTAYPASQKHL